MPRFDGPCRENVFALFREGVEGLNATLAKSAQVGPRSARSNAFRLQTIEQPGLQVFRHAAVDGPMAAIIRPVDKAWIALGKEGPCLIATAGEALLLPNLVEPTRVAAVAHHQIFEENAEQAG